MNGTIDTERAMSFQATAELYDAVRPGYPTGWIGELQNCTGLTDKTSILEVGSGTGLATADLITVTKHIVCIEPGQAMLDIAKAKYPELQYVKSTFEAYKYNELFDMIVSAMAWHWVDPMIAYRKAAELLGANGYLVVIRYYHIDDDPNSFHNQAQHIYEKYSQDSKNKYHEVQLQRIKDDADVLNGDYFRLIRMVQYPWQKQYSIKQYLELRNTYSDHLTMHPSQRQKLESELTAFAQQSFNGNVIKKYTTVLFIAQKQDA